MIAALISPAEIAMLARSQSGWTFDLASATIGFVLGLLLALAIYLLRHRLAGWWEAIASGVGQARDHLSTGVADRYREYLIQTAEESHLLKSYVPVSKIYVEPSLAVPPMHAHAIIYEESQDAERWRAECLHDLLYPRPAIIRLGDALRQSHCLAILGPTGSGKTTLLRHISQQFARRDGWRWTCAEPQDTDPPEIRSAREREQERLPVWIALESLTFETVDGGRHALLKPITDYIASSLPRLIAGASAEATRVHLIAGQCLLLCDNLDMLDERTSQQALDWLDNVYRAYPGNMIVIAGLPDGYGRLIDLGFGPLMLDGFNGRQVAHFVEQWQMLRQEDMLAAWEKEAVARRTEWEEASKKARVQGQPQPAEVDFAPPERPVPVPGLLNLWKEGRREHVLPLDLSLAALLWRAQDAVPSARPQCFAQATVLALNHTENSLLSPPHWGAVLSSVAWTMHLQNRHQVHRDEIERLIADLMSQLTAPPVSPLPAQSGELSDQTPGETPAKTPSDLGRLAHAALQALLQASDLLVDAGRGQVTFVHPSFRSYFAAQYVSRQSAAQDNPIGTLVTHIRDPRWQEMLLFYVALAPAAPLVTERIREADDILRTNFFAAADYLAVSPEADRQLLGGVLAELAQIVLDPTRPIALRRHAAAVIAQAEPKGAVYLFSQAARNADPQVRILGMWGLGQMDDERGKDTRTLTGLMNALSDPDRLVKSEALHALGRRGSDRALDGLIQGLQDEDDLVRQVAAETLGGRPGEGHNVLRDAVKSQDMYIRRAAIQGLAVIGEPWAEAIIEQASREDREWFVRSAALSVLDQMRASAPSLSPEHGLDQEAWLTTWAARQGVMPGTSGASFEILTKALIEGDGVTRFAAAQVLRALGDVRAIVPLRSSLGDPDLLVRNAAYAALCEIGQRSGMSILAEKSG